jgi:signal transduction histidine kinase
MERVTNRLWARVTSVVLVIHAVLLPALYFGLLFIVQQSHTEIFVGQVRTYARLLADELELGDALTTPERTRALLDGIILSGQGVYAEVDDGSKSIRSGLIEPGFGGFKGDDFKFGDHSDAVYFLSVPVSHAGYQAVLRLGFDETPTAEQIEAARERILVALLAFTLVSVALAIWLATRIARPMIHLQKAARRIAAGDFESHLEAASSITEVAELARHLESMRSELVGINARLSREMVERASVDAQRRTLEGRLRQRERIAAVGTLAGGIAHEFNNIMTPVLLYAQNALDELGPDAAVSEDLRRVIAAAHRARVLVRRVMTFSRDFGTSETRLVRVGPVVTEVVELMRAIMSPNVEIVGEIGADLPEVVGDAGLFHQLLMNLCTNAYQAMRASGGRLTVGLSRSRVTVAAADQRVAPGDYLLLDVSDTGHGIDEPTMKRIFDPFFTTREVGEGSGLGLSVVHGIATSLGASVVVDSEPGVGTHFRLYFPLPATAAAVPATSGDE